MKRLVRISPFALAGLVAAAAPVGAQGIGTEALRLWGGTWMADCGHLKSAKVTVLEDAVVFLDGDQRVAGSNVQIASGWLGNNPPPEFVTAIIAESGAAQLYAVISKDERGEYLQFDADPPLRDRIGTAAIAHKYRRCGASPAAAAPAPAVAAADSTPAAKADFLPGGPELLADAAFRRVYQKALGALAKQEDWLMRLDGPARETRRVVVAGTPYLLISVCKIHDCAESNTVLLYSSEKKAVYGQVLAGGKALKFGSPPPAVAKALGETWRQEWGENR